MRVNSLVRRIWYSSSPCDDTGSMRFDRDHPELRDAVRRVCNDFPAAYWRELDERRAHLAGSHRDVARPLAVHGCGLGLVSLGAVDVGPGREVEHRLWTAPGDALAHCADVGDVDVEVDRGHLVPAREMLDQIPAEHARCPGDQDTHL